MIYLYLFGTCFHFIYVFMIIGNKIILFIYRVNCIGLSDNLYRLIKQSVLYSQSYNYYFKPIRS